MKQLNQTDIIFIATALITMSSAIILCLMASNGYNSLRTRLKLILERFSELNDNYNNLIIIKERLKDSFKQSLIKKIPFEYDGKEHIGIFANNTWKVIRVSDAFEFSPASRQYQYFINQLKNK